MTTTARIRTGTRLPAGRHRRYGALLPEPPSDAEKNSYAERVLPHLVVAIIVGSSSVIIGQVLLEINFPITLPFAAYTLLYLAYQATSLPMNFTGRSFDLAAHQNKVQSWRPPFYPSVDIYLPICGEPLDVLHNTWIGVFELLGSYPGVARAYVLDDGPSDEARALAVNSGFVYIRRPNVRQFKKSGNLRHAFGHTSGDYIVIFDADFRPRSDFLAETLPYMDDPSVGIVQTPQYFRVDRRQTWVERAAGATLEIFYRVVQLARDRFGSALCVGSNAVYRRAALQPAGGFTMIPYAEDSHTGLDMRYHGYALKYIPVPLATGVCPATLDMFMRQQYRWCCGATSLIWTRRMWRVPMPLLARLPYVAGWLWNLTTALRTLIVPLIPVTILIFMPREVRLRNILILVPAVMTGALLYPLWHNSPYSPRIWPLSIAVGWAQALALWDYARGRVMSWQPSRGPADTTRRFWRGVTLWNGTLAIVWLTLAVWRIAQTHSFQFAIVLAFGILNAVIVARLVFPGRERRKPPGLAAQAAWQTSHGTGARR